MTVTVLPLRLGEGCRKLVNLLLLVTGGTLLQVGLALLGFGLFVRRILLHPHTLSREITAERLSAKGADSADSALWFYTSCVTVAGALVTSSALLSLLLGFASRTRRKSHRRTAVRFGYLFLAVQLTTVLYLAVTSALLTARTDDFGLWFQRTFAALMWNYMTDVEAKVLVDTVQQHFRCCGSQTYSDWYIVDWYPQKLYGSRYKGIGKYRYDVSRYSSTNKNSGLRYLKKSAMKNYGSTKHRNNILTALEVEYTTGNFLSSLLQVRLKSPFAEVPFSCCDPSVPYWCHQRYPNTAWYNHQPDKHLSIYATGCVYRIEALFEYAVVVLLGVMVTTLIVETALLVLYRYSQTSTWTALKAGRHLSSASGYLLKLPVGGGDAAADAGDVDEKQLLLEPEDASGEMKDESKEVDEDTDVEEDPIPAEDDVASTEVTDVETSGAEDTAVTTDTETEVTTDTEMTAAETTEGEATEDDNVPPIAEE